MEGVVDDFLGFNSEVSGCLGVVRIEFPFVMEVGRDFEESAVV